MSTQFLKTHSKHGWTVVGLADHAWNIASERAIRASWKPVIRLAEAGVIALMQNISRGNLRVLTYDHIYNFPALLKTLADDNEHPKLKAELRVINDVFWIRLFTMGDLGFAEAYMYGDVECDDLVILFKMFLLNRENLSNLTSMVSYLFTLPQCLTNSRFLNTISNSRSNISAHYDISNDMFAGFLSEDMTYSCAIFDDLDGDVKDGSDDCALWSGGQNSERLGNSIKTLVPPLPTSNGNIKNGTADCALGSGRQTERLGNSIKTPVLPLPTSNGAIKNGTADYALWSGRQTSERVGDPIKTPVPPFPISNGDIKNGIDDCALWSGGQNLERLGNPIKTPVPPLPTSTPVDPLYTAQLRKIRHIISKADIHAGHRVLEIGSGWGSLAIEAVRLKGCIVDTITLSVQQQELAQERIRAAGLEDKITVHLMDYRDMPPEWEGAFDRLVSIEMIEAVGREFLEKYWSVVDWALKIKGGVGVVQVITIPEPRFDRYIREIDFILFPGGFLPTLTLLLDSLKTGSKGRLIVDSIVNIAPHYARTLREWRRRFLARFDSVIVPALKREYPDVMGGQRGLKEIEVFKRKWMFAIVKSDLLRERLEIILSPSRVREIHHTGVTSTIE